MKIICFICKNCSLTKPILMKTKFKFALIFAFFALFIFTSCQNEVLEETQNLEETFAPNSTVANLMRSTAARDGHLDDILDDANCISINLPVTIIANGITITINTLEDLALLEEIFDEFQNDDDILDFLFPITIILNDHTEIVIENADQLQDFIERCTNDNDVIECVDFVYPISFSIYNTDFQIIDTVVIENDEQLYRFLDSLEDSPNGAVLVSLNFPVSLVYADGTIVEVHSIQELEAAINAAEEECDDVNDNCNEDRVAMYLTECFWRVVAFNGDDNLVQYEMHFGADGLLTIIQEGDIAYSGNWQLSTTDNGLILFIETTLEDINGAWNVVGCRDDRIALVQENGSAFLEVVIERECETDVNCSAQEISRNLQECVWYAGSNLIGNDFNGPFHFTPNGVIFAAPNGTAAAGTWDVILTDEGVFLVLNLPEPYEALSLEWRIIECSAHRLEMVHGDNHLVLEQDCTDVYDCPDQQANFGDACETPDGALGFINENCECQVDDNQFDCSDLQANIGDACETANGAIGVINENCECAVDNTNPFDCFSNTELVICDDDVIDGFEAFNLETVYPNCPNDDVEITYHSSLGDAETDVFALTSPYVNTTNPETIYARVALAGNNSVYEIFEVHLFVENCSQGNCSDQQISDFLMECAWIPVSVDGSNDFNQVYMLFNANQDLVVEGLGLNSTGNWIITGNANDGVYLLISGFNDVFQVFIGEWLVAQCSETELVLINNANNNQIILQRECN